MTTGVDRREPALREPLIGAPLVVVVGSLNLDLVVTTARFPRPGETLSGASFRSVPGGKGLNQAVAASRAGSRVEMIGAVGSDAHGAQIRDLLVREGIGTEHLEISAAPTGTAHIQVDARGENTIVVVPGANHDISPLSTAARALIAKADAVLLQGEIPIESTRAAAALARTAILTPAPVGSFAAGLPANIAVLIGNRTEISQLGGVEQIPVPIVIETLGADGVRWAVDGRVAGRLPARSAPVVDTTAAGDTFVGAMAAALSRGTKLVDALAWATAAASIAVSRPGASSSIPLHDEIDAASAG